MVRPTFLTTIDPLSQVGLYSPLQDSLGFIRSNKPMEWSDLVLGQIRLSSRIYGALVERALSCLHNRRQNTSLVDHQVQKHIDNLLELQMFLSLSKKHVEKGGREPMFKWLEIYVLDLFHRFGFNAWGGTSFELITQMKGVYLHAVEAIHQRKVTKTVSADSLALSNEAILFFQYSKNDVSSMGDARIYQDIQRFSIKLPKLLLEYFSDPEVENDVDWKDIAFKQIQLIKLIHECVVLNLRCRALQMRVQATNLNALIRSAKFMIITEKLQNFYGITLPDLEVIGKNRLLRFNHDMNLYLHQFVAFRQ